MLFWRYLWPRLSPEAIEEIEIEIRGPGDQRMSTINLIPVQSSNIEAVGHDPHSKTLTVKFKNGGTYEYSGVDANEYNAFMSARSKGAYFHTEIRRRFTGRKTHG